MQERLKREILSGFPYPIVAYLIKLGTGECLTPGPLRLKYILAAGEAVSRFLGVVALCECREFIENTDQKPPASLVADFSKRFKAPSWGNWLHFTREALKWLDGAGAVLTMGQVVPFFFSKIPAESGATQTLGKLLVHRSYVSYCTSQRSEPRRAASA